MTNLVSNQAGQKRSCSSQGSELTKANSCGQRLLSGHAGWDDAPGISAQPGARSGHGERQTLGGAAGHRCDDKLLCEAQGQDDPHLCLFTQMHGVSRRERI